jgi:spore coat polysaccharide biosynthesis predicted glycosyltransferase SpsG
MNDFTKYNTVCHLGSVNKVNKHQIAEAITYLAKDYKKRLKMSKASKSTIDGKGIERIFYEIPRGIFDT